MFIPSISAFSLSVLLGPLFFSASRHVAAGIPLRSNTALCPLAMPTTLSCSPRVRISFSRCDAICSSSFEPTVPTPHTKRFNTWYSLRKKLSWITLSDLRSMSRLTTSDTLISAAPCAIAMMFIPLRPNTPKSFPAMPGVCFILSPTTATVERFPVSATGFIAPVDISLANSCSSIWRAFSPSLSVTQRLVLASDEVWATRNTLTPPAARLENIRWFTPITPTIEGPLTVTRLVFFIDEMPLIARLSSMGPLCMMLPGASGWKVFLT